MSRRRLATAGLVADTPAAMRVWCPASVVRRRIRWPRMQRRRAVSSITPVTVVQPLPGRPPCPGSRQVAPADVPASLGSFVRNPRGAC